VWLQSEKLTTYQASESQRRKSPHGDTYENQDQDFAHDHHNDVAAQCSERYADPNFTRPPQDCVGHDAVQPNDCEQRRYGTEDRGKAGDQSLGPQRESNLFVHGLQRNDWNMRIELAHAFAKLILDLARISLCPEIDVHETEMGPSKYGK
jgi:hypothetical protein